MRYRRTFGFIAFMGIFAYSQSSINIRGTVTSAGQPIEGASLTLLGRGMSATTDNMGQYSITGTLGAIFPSGKPEWGKISFNHGILEISLYKSSPLKVQVFDINGNLIINELSEEISEGVYRMDIAGIAPSSKLMVVKASIGGQETIYRYFPLTDGNYELGGSNVSGKTEKLSKAAAVVDTLMISKSGYTTKKMPIESYDAVVDVTLTGGGATAFVEDSGLDCDIGASSGSNGGSNSVLPDPFTKWDGTQVRTMEDWRCRRRELVVEVGKVILGDKAPPPHTIGGTVTGSVTNTSYTVEVDNPGGSTSFSGTITLPGTGSAPYPAIIVVGGFNSLPSSAVSALGVATISYNNNDIASEASGNYTTGKYYDANPDYEGNTSALVAWAWGVSRMLDLFELHPDVIDASKIGVHGCSRLGKAAFVIGAYDQRIALGLPLEPGTGGPAPLRAVAVYGGQSISSMMGESSWFSPPVTSFSGNSSAADMSDVAAMYAPRGLLMMDNPHIQHLSYQANYLGVAAAQIVYEAMGKEGGAWYLGSSNNGNHCSDRAEYHDAIEAMVRKFLKGEENVTTGGLDRHSNHGNIDVDAWTSSWDIGPISE